MRKSLLKHGRKAITIFLYGLEYLSEIFLNLETRRGELAFVFERMVFKDFEK